VGCFLDSYGPAVEKRHGDEVSVVTMVLRVQPFDAKMATSVDEGLGDQGVRSQLFKLSTAEMKPHVERVNFNLDCPRQQMQIFASSDTEESRIAFDQVKIAGAYARTQKDVDGYAFVFKATFGPVGRDELEYIHSMHRKQMCISFLEAEPSLDFEEDEDEGDDEPGDTIDGRVSRFAGPPLPIPIPEHDDIDDVIASAPPREDAVRRPRAVHAKQAKNRKRDPEGERNRQAKAGKKQARGSKSNRR
jgi:hypothetical protein